MEKFSRAQIEEVIPSLSRWTFVTEEGCECLRRTIDSKSYAVLSQAAAEIAKMAEEKDHHPRMVLDYNYLEITLSTHSVGGITGEDVEFAHQIDRILENR